MGIEMHHMRAVIACDTFMEVQNFKIEMQNTTSEWAALQKLKSDHFQQPEVAMRWKGRIN